LPSLSIAITALAFSANASLVCPSFLATDDSNRLAESATGLKVMQLAYQDRQWDLTLYEGERLRLQGLANASVHLIMSQAAFAKGDFGLAHALSACACSDADSLSPSDSELARRLWFASDLHSPAHEKAWQGLRDTIQSISNVCAHFTDAEKQSAHSLLDQLLGPPVYSPPLATSLALLPGVGYAYAGESRTAMTTVILVAGLYAAGAAYALNEAPWRAGACFTLGGVFHLSSIFGSGQAAVNANAKQKRRLIRDFQPTWFGFQP
jgi:hypothetical protein